MRTLGFTVQLTVFLLTNYSVVFVYDYYVGEKRGEELDLFFIKLE